MFEWLKSEEDKILEHYKTLSEIAIKAKAYDRLKAAVEVTVEMLKDDPDYGSAVTIKIKKGLHLDAVEAIKNADVTIEALNEK